MTEYVNGPLFFFLPLRPPPRFLFLSSFSILLGDFFARSSIFFFLGPSAARPPVALLPSFALISFLSLFPLPSNFEKEILPAG